MQILGIRVLLSSKKMKEPSTLVYSRNAASVYTVLLRTTSSNGSWIFWLVNGYKHGTEAIPLKSCASRAIRKVSKGLQDRTSTKKTAFLKI